MQIKTPIEFQTFNDGICIVCSVGNIADPGNLPKDGLTVKIKRIPYERRKVGVTRFYAAKQANVKVDCVLRIPYCKRISTNDVCVVNEEQYRIKQVQHNYDTLPQSSDMTLEKLEVKYDIKGVP